MRQSTGLMADSRQHTPGGPDFGLIRSGQCDHMSLKRQRQTKTMKKHTREIATMRGQSRSKRITRRAMLKTLAMSVPAVGLGTRALAAAQSRSSNQVLGKNVVLFITDQERAIQHFPVNWERNNLPGLTRLKRNGLSFERAFTDACMCSPARSTLMSGYFPAQHGVKYTLEQDMTDPNVNPQVELPHHLPNIASVMSAAGYNVVYKGKWHCSKPANPNGVWVPSDVGQYGFTRWNPQDAGANQNPDEGGGAPTIPPPWTSTSGNNDGRFMYDDGDYQDGEEGVLAYLDSVAVDQQPFFLIVSLVNPHDVLFYPKTYTMDPPQYCAPSRYCSWLAGDIQIPTTIGESLATKPSVQQQFFDISLALGALNTPEKQRNYVNFYANLMKSSDNYLVQVLDKLDALGLTNDTLIIRTADHGEMGLSHGGLRQKNFNFYEESIRVPLVYSNPQLYPTPRTSNALVSHVDFLPTIASLFDVRHLARAPWQGVDYSRLVLQLSSGPVQNYIVFTYDDYQSGQAMPPYPTPPNHIVSIREDRFKLAQYYDVDHVEPSQWEMYDLLADPLEVNNLANVSRTPQQQREYERLQINLAHVKLSRLQPLS
jgi:choline-sulfatase